MSWRAVVLLGGPFLPSGFDAAKHDDGHLLRSRVHTAQQCLDDGSGAAVALVVAGRARALPVADPALIAQARRQRQRLGNAYGANSSSTPHHAPLRPRCASQGEAMRNALVQGGQQRERRQQRVVMEDGCHDVVDAAFATRRLLLAELARWRRGSDGGGGGEEEEACVGAARCEVVVVTSAFALPRARLACAAALDGLDEEAGVAVSVSYAAAPDMADDRGAGGGGGATAGEARRQRERALACLVHTERVLQESWLPARLALQSGGGDSGQRQQAASAAAGVEADWLLFKASGVLPGSAGGASESDGGGRTCSCDASMLCLHRKRPRTSTGTSAVAPAVPAVEHPAAGHLDDEQPTPSSSGSGNRKACGCDASMLCLHTRQGAPEDAFVPAARVVKAADLLPCGCDPLTMRCMH